MASSASPPSASAQRLLLPQTLSSCLRGRRQLSLLLAAATASFPGLRCCCTAPCVRSGPVRSRAKPSRAELPRRGQRRPGTRVAELRLKCTFCGSLFRPLRAAAPASPDGTFLFLPEMFFASGLKVARSSPAEGL